MMAFPPNAQTSLRSLVLTSGTGGGKLNCLGAPQLGYPLRPLPGCPARGPGRMPRFTIPALTGRAGRQVLLRYPCHHPWVPQP